MGFESKISTVKSNLGVEAKEELYHHKYTCIFVAGFIIMDMLDMK